MTSMMQTIVSGSTRCPDVDERRLTGGLRAVERPQHRGGDRGESVRPRRLRGFRRVVRRSLPWAGARARGASAPRSPLTTCSEKSSVSRAEFGQVRLVDDPQDLADVFVVSATVSPWRPCAERAHDQRHRRRRLGRLGLLGQPGDRSRLDDEQLAGVAARQRPLDVLVAAEVALDALANRRRARASRSAIEARDLAPVGGDIRADRAGAARVGHVLDLLGVHVLAHDLAGDLADEVVVGSDFAADDREPEPPARVDRDHARIAADRVAGEHHA